MRTLLLVFLLPLAAPAQESLAARAERYLTDLLRLDTSNQPGNETLVAQYIAREMLSHRIPCELLGPDPQRLNVICRLNGGNQHRPLLLIAHSDVVPIEPKLWTVPAFAAVRRDGFLYGRGAVDTKNLLAAHMAILVDLKRSGAKLNRDLILLSEADEEAGSTGIQWLIRHAWDKIDAEYALNEGGAQMATAGGIRVYQVQTSEKIPTRMILTARGAAGHGSLPRKDNAVAHLADAISKLVRAYQPVSLNTTTRRYFREIAKLPAYTWLQPHLAALDDPKTRQQTANEIGDRDLELDAALRTTVSPTMLRAGMKVNVIPNQAEAQIDVRRLPNETKEEVYARFRQIINDPAIELLPDPGQEMPATEPSSLTTSLYQAMETVFAQQPGKTVTIPYMSRGATDGAFLRAKGIAVYGVPVFLRHGEESRAHGNDERILLTTLHEGTALLKQVIEAVALAP
jgi:acetylornithine deacetylase/succinyl-diaminopimelate desuccinylase-like protein